MEDLRVALGATWGPLVVVFVPALGGALVTPIVVHWAPDVRGSGIPSVMLAVSNFGGRVAKRIAAWRPLATALSVGSGASLGTEGPVVQLGAAIASLVADTLRFGHERRRSLVAVAAASGVAASFNAPIAGVLFALEVILGRFNNRYFALVVIGAVSASAVSRTFLGGAPAFVVPDYAFDTPLKLPLYILLGLCCGLVAVAFMRAVVAGEDLFNQIRLSPWLRPALGGLLLGILGLWLPEVLGRGYEATDQALSGERFGAMFALLLAAAKTVATSLSLASWGSGGIFGPTLMIGAMFGSAFGELTARLLPDLGATPGSFSLVGMAAVFSAVTRAPMSSIMMIFEGSGSYQMILPLLLAAVIATLLADALHPESIYQLILSRRGLNLMRLRESDLLQTVRVHEVMRQDIPRLEAENTLEELTSALSQSHHHGFVLSSRNDPEHIFGIVTLADLERARQEGLPPQTRLREIATTTVHCALPEEPISEVLERMVQRSIGRMPVVDPQDRRKPIGFVGQSDLARAYYQALQRQRQLEQNSELRRLRDLTGQEIVEVKVSPACPLAGKTLREARLPKESVIISIRRGGKTLFPNGDTRLEPGDTVVANVAPGFGSTFRELLSPRSKGALVR